MEQCDLLGRYLKISSPWLIMPSRCTMGVIRSVTATEERTESVQDTGMARAAHSKST